MSLNMYSFEINGRRVGHDEPPYVIAEMSANHNGDFERALAIIDMAHQAGADAVKLQSYSADTLTINSDREEFQIHGGLWDGRNLYELYQSSQMPWSWHAPLIERGRELGITVFSSPFDSTAVDLLASLNVPAYKISSFELVDLPLIEHVARQGKPMVMSSGMANEQEIEEAIECAQQAGCRDIVLLHCVSGYPAPAGDYNLRTLQDMAKRFGVLTGLSDHTIDNTTAIAAVALGACLIEKHVTLDRAGGGPDDSFSLEPPELLSLVKGARIAWEALGSVDYSYQASEKDNVKFRRSLYFVSDVPAGEVIGPEHVRSIRPGYGLPPRHLPEVLGRRAAKAIKFGTPVSWSWIQ